MIHINGYHNKKLAPYLYIVIGWGVMSCVMRHGIPVWQHSGQSNTATSRHCHDVTSDIKATLNNKSMITGNQDQENLNLCNNSDCLNIFTLCISVSTIIFKERR